MRRVAQALGERGIRVVTFDFPYMAAGKRVPDPGPVLEAAFQSQWQEATAGLDAKTPVFAGGKSMGGRIASQAAARDLFSPPPAGLIFFGYPLHPPGKSSQRRDKHLPAIAAPMLFLHGSRDPFGSPDEMRGLVDTLPNATLEVFEGGDHSLGGSKRNDKSGEMLTRAVDRAAEWIFNSRT